MVELARIWTLNNFRFMTSGQISKILLGLKNNLLGNFQGPRPFIIHHLSSLVIDHRPLIIDQFGGCPGSGGHLDIGNSGIKNSGSILVAIQ